MKRTRFRTILSVLLLALIASTSNIFADSTTDGFSSGTIIVLISSANSVRGTASLTASKTSCTEGESVTFTVAKASASASFVGGTSTHNLNATYKYDNAVNKEIIINGTEYIGGSYTKKFTSKGTYNVRGKLTLRYKTTDAKVRTGFPRYFYKTIYSSYKTVTVKAVPVNNPPAIVSSYISIGGNRTTASLYNNTDSVRFCADFKDIDGDTITPSSGPLKRDGVTMYDGVSHSSLSSTTGVARTRGPYSNMKRGTWSIVWSVTDGKKSASNSFSKVVHNRAPVITSCSASPTTVDEGGSVTFRATATDADGDSIDSLRLYVNNSSGSKVYPASANFKYVAQNYSSGTQKTITLDTDTMGLKGGTYTACLYAVDGYDGSTKSGTQTVSFTVRGSDGPKIVETYTKINDVRTTTALYNNTTGIKLCASIKGKADKITTSDITVNGTTKYENATHSTIDSTITAERYRGTYNNPVRGTWSLTWRAYLGSKSDSKTHSREVRNRAPVISSYSVSPTSPTTQDTISIRVTPLDPDMDDIRSVNADVIKNSTGEEWGFFTGGRTKPGVQQTITIEPGTLSQGTYTAKIYASDDFDGTESEPVSITFTVGEATTPTPSRPVTPTPPVSPEPVEPNPPISPSITGEITGARVYHTDLWDGHRKAFNRFYFGGDFESQCSFADYAAQGSPRKRGTNIFWSGERFMVEAKTADTAKVERVKVSIEGTTYSADLTLEGGKGDKWKGSIFDRTMVGKWGQQRPEILEFVFTAYYTGGSSVTQRVEVIVDSTINYWDLHRKE